MGADVVVESVAVRAGTDAVWAAVSDPTSYPRWSPETTRVRRLGRGSGRWSVGDRFVGFNRAVLPWATVGRVFRVEPGHAFGFDVDFGPLPVSRWEYEVEPRADGRTRVLERWTDRRIGWPGVLMKPSGLLVGRGPDAAARNRSTMRVTLDRLRDELE